MSAIIFTSVCSLLRDVAAVVRVAVCDQDDRQAASEALGELATVVVVPCGQKPRNLPFLALHDAVSTFAGKAYVAFGEADLTWRFASCARLQLLCRPLPRR